MTLFQIFEKIEEKNPNRWELGQHILGILLFGSLDKVSQVSAKSETIDTKKIAITWKRWELSLVEL